MTPPPRELDAAGATYQVIVAAEQIMLLGEPGSTEGYRVRYRELGTRRWAGVLLVDHDHEPTELELAAAIAFHRFGVIVEPYSFGGTVTLAAGEIPPEPLEQAPA